MERLLSVLLVLALHSNSNLGAEIKEQTLLHRSPRWALDANADYVNTPFRFYNYGTQNCIRVSGGGLYNGGICEAASDIFTFYLEDVTYWEDALEAYNTIEVVKFVHKDSGHCLAGTGSDTLSLETCTKDSVNQGWRKVNSWQGARLYLVFQNLGRAKCLSDDGDDVFTSAPYLAGLDYGSDFQWWQLAAAE